MHAVQLKAYGNPIDGLEYVELPEPDPPGANEVLIGVELSPINPNDLMLARGIYASLFRGLDALSRPGSDDDRARVAGRHQRSLDGLNRSAFPSMMERSSTIVG